MSTPPQEALHGMRVDYRKDALDETDLAADPVEQFRLWFDEATAAKVVEPNAMTFATATPDGIPSARVLLLKEFDQDGFIFFTNYGSRKGRELLANPRGAMVFFWQPLERQVRIEGTVERVSREKSLSYFEVRPKASRLGAWASRQSDVVASREVIEQREAELTAEFGENIPLPDFWGGYVLKPTSIEFWQGRPGRLHDRLRYQKIAGVWKIDRLSP
ncbi:MAG: pyridoxamine 5'-phosphate oxidase [Tepidisphaeraceae bacterium]